MANAPMLLLTLMVSISESCYQIYTKFIWDDPEGFHYQAKNESSKSAHRSGRYAIQTSFHIIWAICGYYFYVCKIRPSHYVIVMVYLTYFYKDECGEIQLDENDTLITRKPIRHTTKLEVNNTDEENVYDIIHAILEKAVLPKESSAAWRTHMYFHAFIISDAIWIISAFLLFAGTCFHIRKCLSLLFYGPWLIVTACIILLDVISAVHFGLDIIQVYNITTWLKFIGVQNYNDFSDYNKNQLSRVVSSVPAVSLCVLFSRMLIFWVLNIVNFFQILTITVLAFQDSLDGNSLRQLNTGSKDERSGDLNLNTSAARIRNWQLFYGATETTSTGSNSSKSSDRDGASSTSFSRSSKDSVRGNTDTFTKLPQRTVSLDTYGRHDSSVRDESIRSRANVSTFYRGFPDVDDEIDNSNEKFYSNDKDNSNDKNVSVIGSLRGQLPWSYFPKPVDIGKNNRDFDRNVAVSEFSRFRAVSKAPVKDLTACSEL